MIMFRKYHVGSHAPPLNSALLVTATRSVYFENYDVAQVFYANIYLYSLLIVVCELEALNVLQIQVNMEIPESSRRNSILFLEDFLKKSSPPCADTSGEEMLPVKVTFPRLAVHELESECLEMARSYISKL